MEYTEKNAQTIDRWVNEGWEWGRPIDHEAFLRAKAGEWEMLLTPVKCVPKAWFPPLRGAAVLGLASGGGQQMPVLPHRAHIVLCLISPRNSLRASAW